MLPNNLLPRVTLSPGVWRGDLFTWGIQNYWCLISIYWVTEAIALTGIRGVRRRTAATAGKGKGMRGTNYVYAWMRATVCLPDMYDRIFSPIMHGYVRLWCDGVNAASLD